MQPLLVSSLAPSFHAEQGAALQATLGIGTALGEASKLGFMHVSVQMQGEAFRWMMDLPIQLIATFHCQPLRWMMRQQQAEVMLIDPICSMTPTCCIELTDMQSHLTF